MNSLLQKTFHFKAKQQSQKKRKRQHNVTQQIDIRHFSFIAFVIFAAGEDVNKAKLPGIFKGFTNKRQNTKKADEAPLANENSCAEQLHEDRRKEREETEEKKEKEEKEKQDDDNVTFSMNESRILTDLPFASEMASVI